MRTLRIPPIERNSLNSSALPNRCVCCVICLPTRPPRPWQELDGQVARDVLENMDADDAARILSEMWPDDAVDVLDEVDEGHRDVLLNSMTPGRCP